MKIHLDTCISPNLARAMRELERSPVVVSIHDEEFKTDEKDVDWLPRLRTLKIDVLLTTDGRIYTSPDERRAWEAARILTYFVSTKFANSRQWHQVEELVRWWPFMKTHAKTAPAGTAWRLPWELRKPVRMGADGREQPIVTR